MSRQLVSLGVTTRRWHAIGVVPWMMMALVALTVAAIASAKTAEEWKSRVVYQIITDRFAGDKDSDSPCADLRDYCGGTWNGIARKLDYIQGLGFNAIWISPIPEQTDKGYHGYWQKNIYNVNPMWGNADDLKSLVDECHKRDIWVMVDVVANHMGIPKDEDDFSEFVPFNKTEYYHPKCDINDWNNMYQVQNCRAFALPDLDQSNSFVRDTLKDWVHTIVSEFGFDAIRCDTVPEVPKDFWHEYAESAGVYSIGEAFSADVGFVASFQGSVDALLNYPLYFALKNVFMVHQRDMREISIAFKLNRNEFSDTTILGNFADNHDNERFLHFNSDWNALKNALTLVMFAEGIPIVYYGTEQMFGGGKDPNNRESLWPHYDTDSELYKFISTIVKFRVQQGEDLYNSDHVEHYSDANFYAFSRGNVFVATTNIGSGHSMSKVVNYHPYKDGTELVNLLDEDDKVIVGGGLLVVHIDNGLPKVYYPAKFLSAPGECKPDDYRIDCGHMGTNEEECESVGCCWKPADGDNVAWCFHKSLESDCEPNEERFDCGWMGITEEDCEHKGCCWTPTPGQPYCYENKISSLIISQRSGNARDGRLGKLHRRG